MSGGAWERSTHSTQVPRGPPLEMGEKWIAGAAGGCTCGPIVKHRRQVDPRPPGSRQGPTLSRWSSHKGLSRSVRCCVERKDAMDGEMKLSWTQMGAQRARHAVRRRMRGSDAGSSGPLVESMRRARRRPSCSVVDVEVIALRVRRCIGGRARSEDVSRRAW